MTSLSCPHCRAECRSEENAASLAGRRLRCPHCRTVWRMGTLPRPEPQPTAGGALVPYQAVVDADEISAPLVPVRRPGRPARRSHTIIDIYPPRPGGAAKSPPLRASRRRIDFGGVAACLAALLLILGAATFRAPLVKLAPGLAGLYALAGLEVNLRGLEFSDVRISRSAERPVLVVDGTVRNVSGDMVDVPAIRLALKSAERREVYSWRVEPTTPRLAPGATFSFRSQIAAPGGEATDVELRFAGRRQQIARYP